uniref:Uncharacterized protein n=1 Tax=Oryza punctata TaxID=4537 RepID=A0A0E0LHN9_ORYPU
MVAAAARARALSPEGEEEAVARCGCEGYNKYKDVHLEQVFKTARPLQDKFLGTGPGGCMGNNNSTFWRPQKFWVATCIAFITTAECKQGNINSTGLMGANPGVHNHRTYIYSYGNANHQKASAEESFAITSIPIHLSVLQQNPSRTDLWLLKSPLGEPRAQHFPTGSILRYTPTTSAAATMGSLSSDPLHIILDNRNLLRTNSHHLFPTLITASSASTAGIAGIIILLAPRRDEELIRLRIAGLKHQLPLPARAGRDLGHGISPKPPNLLHCKRKSRRYQHHIHASIINQSKKKTTTRYISSSVSLQEPRMKEYLSFSSTLLRYNWVKHQILNYSNEDDNKKEGTIGYHQSQGITGKRVVMQAASAAAILTNQSITRVRFSCAPSSYPFPPPLNHPNLSYPTH